MIFIKNLTTNNILDKKKSLIVKFILSNGELIKKTYFFDETITVPKNTAEINIEFIDDMSSFPTFIHGIYVQLKYNEMFEIINNFILSQESSSYNLNQDNQNMLVLEKKMSGNEIIDLMRHLYNLKLGISDLKPNKQSIKIRNYLISALIFFKSISKTLFHLKLDENFFAMCILFLYFE